MFASSSSFGRHFLFIIASILASFSCSSQSTRNVTGSAVGQSNVLIKREYCNMETFNATCPSPDDVILVRSARYGRMQLGRCVRRNLGYVGCVADVLTILDARCSARRRCEMTIPDPELYATQACPADTTPYLEVAYECLTVAGDESCATTSHPSVVLRNKFGYILATRDVTTDGPWSCRWSIQGKPGQRVNLTLYHFGRVQSSSAHHSSSSLLGVAGKATADGDASLMTSTNIEGCYDLATAAETAATAGGGSGGGQHHQQLQRRPLNVVKRLTTCGSGPAIINGRERHLYESIGHSLDVHLTTNIALVRQKLGRFLIKYEIVSCPDMADPPHGRAKRDGDMVVITCSHSNEEWYLTCKGEEWIGTYGNCSHASSASANIQKTGVVGLDSFPYGILIVVAVGVALGVLLGGLLLIFVVLYMKRRHRRPCDELPPTMLAAGPNRMLSSSSTVSSPAHQFYPVCTASHLHVDKYSTGGGGGLGGRGRGGCWFEPTLRGGGGHHNPAPVAAPGQLCWDQTVKFIPADDDDLLTTPDMYSGDKTWTAVAKGDGTVVGC